MSSVGVVVASILGAVIVLGAVVLGDSGPPGVSGHIPSDAPARSVPEPDDESAPVPPAVPERPEDAPPTSAAVPDGDCIGVVVTPDDDLAETVGRHPAGTTFCLAAGIHREASVVPLDGMRFVGEAGAVLSGARVLLAADAEFDGRTWFLDGQDQEGIVHGVIEEGGNEQHRRPEDVFVDDVRLEHVEDHDALDAPGEWWFDYDNDRIHLAEDPAQLGLIETSVSPFAIAPDTAGYGTAEEWPDDVVVQDLVVEKYANPPQSGAIGADVRNDNASESWTVRHVEVRLTHGCGVRLVPGGTVEYSRVRDNGQVGLCGASGENPQAPGSIVRHNEVVGNGQLDFLTGWERGATKFSDFTDLLVAHNWVHDNRGPGLWFDIDNEDVVVRSNLVEDNDQAGIFYEISRGDTDIHWNLVRGNGRAASGDGGAGIEVSNSSGDDGWIEVWENAVHDNRWGLFAHDEGVDDDGVSGDNRLGLDDQPINLTRYWAHDNHVGAPEGHWVHQITIDDPSEDNLRIEGNAYYVSGPDARLWPYSFDSGEVVLDDFAVWQALGFDIAGTIVVDGSTPALPPEAEPFTPAIHGPRWLD